MTKKYIPGEGEIFKGYIPAVKKILHVSAGVATTNPDVVLGDTGVYEIVSVSMPIVVFNTWTQVEEAFTASVTLTIGDTASADRYGVDTTMNVAATGAVLVAGALTVPALDAVGIPINITQAGATAAAGLIHVYIEYAELND